MPITTIASVIASLLLVCPGCRLGYLMHAGLGQFHVLRDSVPMEQALEDGSLSPVVREHLQLVTRIKEFGVRDLGLKETGSYRSVYLHSGRRPVYLVSASPRDRLAFITWWFPIVGDVPYLGFFDRKRALKELEELRMRGLDTHMGMADAYSTLGWFDDPVTLDLLEGSTVDLVETVLHEMTHETLYVPGQGEFNEGLAALVGKAGAARFLEKTYGPLHKFTMEAIGVQEDERIFSAYLNTLMERLEEIYGSPLDVEKKMARKQWVLSDALDEFKTLKTGMKTRRFAGFGAGTLNNAYLMSVGLYHRRYREFEAVLAGHENSVKAMMSYFAKLSREKGDLMEKVREFLAHTKPLTLETGCPYLPGHPGKREEKPE
jgi:predicted aminopeptidase